MPEPEIKLARIENVCRRATAALNLSEGAANLAAAAQSIAKEGIDLETAKAIAVAAKKLADGAVFAIYSPLEEDDDA